MHDKLSQAVKLYDQLLSRPGRTPFQEKYCDSRFNISECIPTGNARHLDVANRRRPPLIGHTFRHNLRCMHTSPHLHISLTRLPLPHLHRIPWVSFRIITFAIHTSYGSSVLQTAPNQGLTQVATSLHPSPPQQVANVPGNSRAFSPLRQGTTNTGQTTLPSFPIAPTLAPQSSYMPSVPQTVIQQPIDKKHC